MKSSLILAIAAALWFTPANCERLSADDGLPEVPPRLNGGYWIKREAEKVVDAKLGITISTPSFSANTWIFAMPEPPETPGQEVLEFITKPDSQTINDKTPLARPIRRCRIDVADDQLRKQAGIDCDYKLRLFNRSLQRGRKPRNLEVEAIDPEDRSRFLRATEECDYRAEIFQTWKTNNQFQRERRQGEIEFARGVFQSLARQYSYLYVPHQDRTASALCQTNRTDCGGLSTLFVTTMRSEGIPARALVGRWAESAVDGETVDGQRYYKYHVIAEFYAQGVGWVPVDLSSGILHDRTPTKQRFFGKDPANFIVMHVDTGIEFDTDLYGDYRAIYFQIPLFWTRGAGTIDDRKLDERWTVNVDSSAAPIATTGRRNRTNGKPKAAYVFLPITHLRQSENMCAPTSASMALLHHGARIPPVRIKALANAVTTKPEFPGTYFEDLVNGLESVGVSWELKYFKTNNVGFEAGLKKILESLDAGNPVIVDTNIPPHGHTVLVNGYDPQRKLISIVDPLIANPGLRRLSYVEFERVWRSLTADIRGVIITSPPKPR